MNVCKNEPVGRETQCQVTIKLPASFHLDGHELPHPHLCLQDLDYKTFILVKYDFFQRSSSLASMSSVFHMPSKGEKLQENGKLTYFIQSLVARLCFGGTVQMIQGLNKATSKEKEDKLLLLNLLVT